MSVPDPVPCIPSLLVMASIPIARGAGTSSQHIPGHSSLDRMARQLPEGLHFAAHPISRFHSSALRHCRPDPQPPSHHRRTFLAQPVGKSLHMVGRADHQNIDVFAAAAQGRRTVLHSPPLYGLLARFAGTTAHSPGTASPLFAVRQPSTVAFRGARLAVGDV